MPEVSPVAGKSGKRATGKKPESSTRTSAKTDGAFGKENIDRVETETSRNRDKSTVHNEQSDTK